MRDDNAIIWFADDCSARTLLLNPQKTLEREALLKRIRELDAEIAQHERNMREGEARLPLEEQMVETCLAARRARVC